MPNTQIIKSGQVVFAQSELIAEGIRVQMWDSVGTYGLIGTAYTDNGGKFSFYINSPLSDLIGNAIIVPEYRTYRDNVLVKNTESNQQNNILLTISENDYDTDVKDIETKQAISFVTVSGKVHAAGGTPVAAVIVNVYEQGFRSETLLAQTTTNFNGEYSVKFNDRAIANSIVIAERGIVVKALDGEDIVAFSGIIYLGDDSEIQANLTIDGEEYLPPSKFENLVARVTYVLDGVSFADFATSVLFDPNEIIADPEMSIEANLVGEKGIDGNVNGELGYIARAIGCDVKLIQEIIKSYQQSIEVGVGHDFMYSLVHNSDLGRNPILTMKETELRNAVGNAITYNLIPTHTNIEIDAFIAAARDFQVAAAKGIIIVNETCTLNDILNNIFGGVNPETDTTDFLDKYNNDYADADAFWEYYSGIDAVKAEKAQRGLRLATITGFQPEMIGSLMTDTVDGIYATATWSEVDWVDYIDDVSAQAQKLCVPAPIIGDNTDEQVIKELYAKKLRSVVQDQYPLTALNVLLQDGQVGPTLVGDGEIRQQVVSFIADNPEFDLRVSNIYDINEENQALDLSNIEDIEEVQQAMAPMQRMFRLVGGNPTAAAALIAADLGSYSAIAAASADDFATAYAGVLGGIDPAYGAYAKAVAMSAVATSSFTALYQANAQQQIGVMNWPARQDPPVQHADPNIKTLFGSTSYCACEQCLSVYSAAAYFTDIMNFLKAGLPGSPLPYIYSELVRRRPDLPHIDMTCKNTNTLMPYIDLVIELLESMILRRFSQPSVFVPDSFQTSGTPKELAAHPEHVYKKVTPALLYTWEYLDYEEYVQVYNRPIVVPPLTIYDHNHKNLTNVVYPFNLPFSMPAEETRTYLGHLGYTRYDVMKMFQPYTSPTSIPDFAIYGELLGITEEEAKIIAGTHALTSNTWRFYGLTASSVTNIIDPSDTSLPLLSGTWSTLLTERLDLLIQQLKMSYKQFLQFLTSDFLNKRVSGVREITVTSKDATKPDTCELSKLKLVFTGSATAIGFLGKLHRFVRLWNTNRLTVNEWDKLFTSLLITTLDASEFGLIGRILQFADRLKMKPTELTGWWWYMDIHQYVDYASELQSKQPSVYDLLYRNRSVLNLPLPEFHDLGGLDPASIPTTELPTQYNGFTAAIAAANNIKETDLLLILDYMGITDFFTHNVTLGELSEIYFFATLCKRTGYTVIDMLKVLYLLKIDILPPVSSQAFIADRLDNLSKILSTVDAINNSSLSLLEMVYLVENYDQAGPVAPAPLNIQFFFEKLRNELKKFPVYDGTVPPVAPTDPDEDITAYNQLVNVIYQHFSKEFNLPSEWVATCLPVLEVDTLPVATPVIEFFISNTFVSSTVAFAPNEATFSPLLYPIYKIVFKWALITQKFRLNSSEFVYLFQNPTTLDFDFLTVFQAVRAGGLETHPALGDLFAGLLQMSRWVNVRDKLSLIEDQLVRLLKAANDDASDVNVSMAAWQSIVNREKWGTMLIELIGNPATITASTPAGLLNARFPEDFGPSNSASVAKLWGMISIMASCLRTGLQPATLQSVLLQGLTMADSHMVILAAKGKHTEDEWAAIAKPLRDTLRKKQRNALVGFVVATPDPVSNPSNIQKWRNENDLYAYLLIDVEMEACMKTSRIKQAICSAQLYIDRVLLGLEYRNGNVTDRITMPVKMKYQWEQWRFWYRVWEANRKVFLYPENWIEPELRDDKSVFFTEMEDKLFQGDVTKQRVEDALWEYLRKLDDVAHLEPMAVCDARDPATNNIITHVVARTYSDPHRYYYRRLVYNQWTPWERMDIEIKGNHLSMIYSNDQLHLFWLTMRERQVPGRTAVVNNVTANDGYSHSKWFYHDLGRTNADSSVNDSSPVYIKQIEITVNLSLFKENQWQAQEIGKEKMYLDINPIAAAYYQKIFPVPGSSPVASVAPTSLGFDESMQRLYSVHTENKSLSLAEMIMSRIYLQTFSAHDSSGNIGLLINMVNGLADWMEYSNNIHLFWYAKDTGITVWDLWCGARIAGFPRTAFHNNKCVNWYRTEVAATGSTPAVLFEALTIHNMVSASIPCYTYIYEDTWAIPSVNRDGWAYHVLGKSPNGRYTVFGYSNIWKNKLNITQKGFFYNDQKYGFFARAVQIPPTGTVSLAAAAEQAANIYYHETSYSTVFNTTIVTAGVPGRGRFYFQSFFHGRTKNFMKALNSGVDNFLKIQTQDQTNTLNWSAYQPTSLAYGARVPEDKVDFAYDSAYGVYNWELFFHMPLLIAKRLSDNQQFEEARKWYHYIFDPTCNIDAAGSISHSKQRFWRFRPFYDEAGLAITSVDDLLSQIHANNADALDQLNIWMDNPFKPHVIARMRRMAYMKNVVMCYMDNLIAWADKLYRQDTIESLNLATNLYIVVANILGERPQEVPKRLTTGPRTVQELMDAGLDAFSNAMVSVENYVDPNSGSYIAPPGTPGGPIKGDGPPLIHLFYYCLPNNPKLLAYWDTIANRLFNIRNCRNIDGQIRELPLFEPPIDPALLVRAAAAGIDASSVLDDLSSPPMPYRFPTILQKANELCNDVKALGGALLSALEKKDAEELALLRSGQEIAVLESMKNMKKVMIDEAAANIEALAKSKDVAQVRLAYYSSRPYKSPREIEHLVLMDESQKHQHKSSNLSAAASVVSIIPQINIQVPFAIGPSFGGQQIAAVLNALSTIQARKAAAKAAEANKALTEAGYERRRDDWVFQADSASKEIIQIERQIIAAQIHKNIAEKDLATQELQITNAKAVDEYMHEKYTNMELYSWMVGQISSTYFQVYQFAYDVAKRAEKSLTFELPWVEAPGGSFIRFGYWDSLKKGLMSGEKLQYDLRKMEMAYLEANTRELELTKHISLAFENPEMLLQLKETGMMALECPAEMFDFDYPGHYRRRVKSISVSIPCVAGPYTTIAATLTQSAAYIETIDPAGLYPSTSHAMVALSGAQNDSGMFELSYRDERFLPFEGSGAICTWHLSLIEDETLRQFDYNTISDVIFHVKYTADNSETKRSVRTAELAEQVNSIAGAPIDLYRYFSLKHEFASKWFAYANTFATDPDSAMEIDLSSALFPYLAHGKNIDVTNMFMQFKFKIPTDTVYDLELDASDGLHSTTLYDVTPPPTIRKHLATVTVAVQITPTANQTFTLKLIDPSLGVDGEPVDMNALLDDIYLVPTYRLSIPTP